MNHYEAERVMACCRRVQAQVNGMRGALEEIEAHLKCAKISPEIRRRFRAQINFALEPLNTIRNIARRYEAPDSE